VTLVLPARIDPHRLKQAVDAASGPAKTRVRIYGLAGVAAGVGLCFVSFSLGFGLAVGGLIAALAAPGARVKQQVAAAQKQLAQAREYQIEPDGVRVRGATYENFWFWSAISGVVEIPGVLLLRLGEKLFLPIETIGLTPEQSEQLRVIVGGRTSAPPPVPEPDPAGFTVATDRRALAAVVRRVNGPALLRMRLFGFLLLFLAVAGYAISPGADSFVVAAAALTFLVVLPVTSVRAAVRPVERLIGPEATYSFDAERIVRRSRTGVSWWHRSGITGIEELRDQLLVRLDFAPDATLGIPTRGLAPERVAQLRAALGYPQARV
jgi:hypothetical protein